MGGGGQAGGTEEFCAHWEGWVPQGVFREKIGEKAVKKLGCVNGKLFVSLSSLLLLFLLYIVYSILRGGG